MKGIYTTSPVVIWERLRSMMKLSLGAAAVTLILTVKVYPLIKVNEYVQ